MKPKEMDPYLAWAGALQLVAGLNMIKNHEWEGFASIVVPSLLVAMMYRKAKRIENPWDYVKREKQK